MIEAEEKIWHLPSNLQPWDFLENKHTVSHVNSSTLHQSPANEWQHQMRGTELWRASAQFRSDNQSCPTLCDPIDCSTPAFPVYPGTSSNSCPLSQWCHPTISSSVVPFSSCPQSFPASESFQTSPFFASGGQSIGVSASASVFPMNIQGGLPLGWTGWISLQSKGLSRVFSNTTVQSINSLVLSFLSSPTLTSIHDCWKNHSFDYTDICWQSNVTAF